jgi:hypothetical protein
VLILLNNKLIGCCMLAAAPFNIYIKLKIFGLNWRSNVLVESKMVSL